MVQGLPVLGFANKQKACLTALTRPLKGCTLHRWENWKDLTALQSNLDQLTDRGIAKNLWWKHWSRSICKLWICVRQTSLGQMQKHSSFKAVVGRRWVSKPNAMMSTFLKWDWVETSLVKLCVSPAGGRRSWMSCNKILLHNLQGGRGTWSGSPTHFQASGLGNPPNKQAQTS